MELELTILIPALNEEQTIGICIKKALSALSRGGIRGEVLISDNGSRDRTIEIAEKLGARVTKAPEKGYGNACIWGFKEARGKYVLMADADDSYNFEEISPYVERLRQGYELVIGNRFKGKIEKGAMPFLHHYLGTPVLTMLMNLFFGMKLGDVNCGMRALTKEGFRKIHVRAGGMEFATEMLVKASLTNLKIAEVSCNLYKDKRNRKPHLRTWSDGWRHLRFMLLFSPTWTFIIPGLVLIAFGFGGQVFLSARDISGANWLSWLTEKHIISFMLLFLTGCQIIALGIIAKVFSFSKHFDHGSLIVRSVIRKFTLERGLLTGASLIAASLFTFVYLFTSYYFHWFVKFSDAVRFDIAIGGASLLMLGIQFIFTSFVLSLFYIKVK